MNNLKPFFKKILELEEPWIIKDISLNQKEWQIDIYLDFKIGSTFPCPVCQKDSCKVHDTTMKTWRHLNIFQYKTYLHARVPRVKCPDHGTHLVDVPWTRKGSGFTLLFERFVMSLISLMPVASAARILDEWDTRIWRIAHHYVDKAVEEQDVSELQSVGVDETAMRRGHRYISAFVDLAEKGAVFVTAGKGTETLENFKSFLEAHNGSHENIRDISIDMSPAFISGVEEHFPKSRITFDKFHIIKLMNEALDKVRRVEQKGNNELKKTRYIWLKNPENLTVAQKEALDQLVGSKNNLKTALAWRIKLSLQDIFTINPVLAPYFLKKWYWWASHSQLEPIVKFAKTVKKHWEGILNYFKSRITNGILESLNSLYKAAAAKARGYRTVRNAITAYYLVAGRMKSEFPEFCNITHYK